MGEGASRSTRMQPHAGKRRPVWTTSSQKIGPKRVCRGLVDLSTISNRSTSLRMKRPACPATWRKTSQKCECRAWTNYPPFPKAVPPPQHIHPFELPEAAMHRERRNEQRRISVIECIKRSLPILSISILVIDHLMHQRKEQYLLRIPGKNGISGERKNLL